MGATIWHPFVKYPLKQFSNVTTIIRQLNGKIRRKKKKRKQRWIIL